MSISGDHLGPRPAALVDGEPSADDRERVLAHLAECAQCRALPDVVNGLAQAEAPLLDVDGQLSQIMGDAYRPPSRKQRAPKPPVSPTGLRYRAVHDRVAIEEIELYAELIIAAERSEEPLSQETIDRLLGLTIRTPPGRRLMTRMPPASTSFDAGPPPASNGAP
jgi:hypothetical protein